MKIGNLNFGILNNIQVKRVPHQSFEIQADSLDTNGSVVARFSTTVTHLPTNDGNDFFSVMSHTASLPDGTILASYGVSREDCKPDDDGRQSSTINTELLNRRLTPEQVNLFNNDLEEFQKIQFSEMMGWVLKIPSNYTS